MAKMAIFPATKNKIKVEKRELNFFGSSLKESLLKFDELPVDLPFTPTPYLISIGIMLTGVANSLANSHLLIQYPSSYSDCVSNFSCRNKKVFGSCDFLVSDYKNHNYKTTKARHNFSEIDRSKYRHCYADKHP